MTTKITIEDILSWTLKPGLYWVLGDADFLPSPQPIYMAWIMEGNIPDSWDFSVVASGFGDTMAEAMLDAYEEYQGVV